MRKFEVRDGKVVVEFSGDDLQILDAMSHRYCNNPSSWFAKETVEGLKNTICDALDFFYMGGDQEDAQGVDNPKSSG